MLTGTAEGGEIGSAITGTVVGDDPLQVGNAVHGEKCSRTGLNPSAVTHFSSGSASV